MAKGSPAPHLPEIREGDAGPEIAALYDDIRRVQGLPMVNLIYRHMATFPGCLEWGWGVLRPHLIDDAVQEAAKRVREGVEALQLEPIDDRALADAGLDPTSMDEIRRVIDAYNRANSMNLVALTALRHAARDELPQDREDRPGQEPPDREIPDLPPLARIGELVAPVAAIVGRFAAWHEGATEAGVTPSFYLQLAYWPQFLSLIETRLTPLFEGHGFRPSVERTRTLAGIEAEALRPRLRATAAPPPSDIRAELAATIETFTTLLIPQMIPVGLALARALG